MKKILMICNTDGALYVFRKPIIKYLTNAGHLVGSISGKSNYFSHLVEMGVITHELDFAPRSISPFKYFQLLVNIVRIAKQFMPDIVHSFTHKPAILGSIAAKIIGVKNIYVTITGLGTLFIDESLKSRLLRKVLIIQYRIALKFVNKVFFQNPDDRDYFLCYKIVLPEQAILVNGSGIDLEEFKIPNEQERITERNMLSSEINENLKNLQVVLFPARGLREKGFFEYYEAAKMLSDFYPSRFVFIHLGFVGSTADGYLTQSDIQNYAYQCNVHYLGFKKNIRDYMLAADVIVLPSYREGVPRSLIEALALGRTIVTTDAPGCRETVIDGWNGYMCQPRDIKSLATQLGKITPDFCSIAGKRSRELCENKFDVRKLIQKTSKYYGISYNTENLPL